MIRRVAAVSAAVAVGMVGLGSIGASGLAGPEPPAGAATATSCSTGVIVAVDFAHWGGNIDSVCDSPLPDNAADALVVAKFRPLGVSEDGGLAFICTIAGDPPDANCNTTPPGNAYWSFWYANAGKDAWTYSPLGAESLVPRAGSVEAWIFGGDTAAHPPSSFPSPNSVRASFSSSSSTTTAPTTASTTTTSGSTTPTGTKHEPTTTTTTTGASSPKSSRHATSGGHHPPTTKPTEKPSREPTSKVPMTSTTAAGRAGTAERSLSDPRALAGRKKSTPRIVDAAPAVAARPPAGSPLPFVIGSMAILVLGGTAGFVAWRRRRTDGG